MPREQNSRQQSCTEPIHFIMSSRWDSHDNTSEDSSERCLLGGAEGGFMDLTMNDCESYKFNRLGGVEGMCFFGVALVGASGVLQN